MDTYLEKVKKIHEEALKTSQQEGNETFRGLNIQLIFFAAAILSFSLFIFLNESITDQLNIYDKWLLIAMWCSLGLSVIFGIKQFLVDCDFFTRYSNLQNYIINKLESDSEITKIKRYSGIYSEEQEEKINEVYKGMVDKIVYEKTKEMALKEYPNIVTESPRIYIQIQAFFVIFSMVLLIVFMAKFLL